MRIDDFAFEPEFNTRRRLREGRLGLLVVSGTGQSEHQGSRDQQDGQPLWAGHADR